MINLKLPFPPSTNHYYRTLRKGAMAGRVIISEKGRQYRALVIQHVIISGPFKKLQGNLSMTIILCPPDRRRRDVDNYQKPLLDALTHAGIWSDDSQVKKLTTEMTDERTSKAIIFIEEKAT